ncbi:unnamed protein product [Rhizoctonia solani]|uniref:NACHT domain-containing protein n=1 Tax=Rhizoctonia solani TaxID=456999 RepID=A0A8H3CWW4_9AGAM|nr:unnamed protein product [Rhizoctonia solani]
MSSEATNPNPDSNRLFPQPVGSPVQPNAPQPSQSNPPTILSRLRAHIQLLFLRLTREGTTNRLRASLQILHDGVEVFPSLQSAIAVLISSIDLLQTTTSRKEFTEITAELQTLSESVGRYVNDPASGKPSKCMANVSLLINQQAELVATKKEQNIGRCFGGSTQYEEEVREHYRRINSLFRQLEIDISMSTWSCVNEQLVNTRLEGLCPAKMASYDSALAVEIDRQSCTEGTRVSVLAELEDWSKQMGGANLYWINGMAGTGKTTIASSFCQKLEESNRLAASFFCSRSSLECRQAQRIIPTIAYQLARYSMPFQQSLFNILKDDPDIGSKTLSRQIERLLKEPFASIKEIPNNLVVVIDALDECDAKTGVELMLSLLIRHSSSLPLRFLVTSRPEPEIYRNLVSHAFGSQLHLHDIEKSVVQHDIKTYLKDKLDDISPTTEEIEQLASRSNNLFIYASTLVRQVRNGMRSAPPRFMLESVLTMVSQPAKKHAGIDQLYTAILELALGGQGDDIGPDSAKGIRAVLEIVLCAQEPIDMDTVAVLTGLSNGEQVKYALQPLLSVLHYSEKTRLVSTLHASFPDFMFNQVRSGEFFCDPSTAHRQIALKCFEVMKFRLRFNICDLESSYKADKDVEDISSRIDNAIPPALWYVCQYWADHLRQTAGADLSQALEDFLSVRLLFWMEVLNLKRGIGMGQGVLLKARQWLQADQDPSVLDLQNFVDDARDFTIAYAASSASLSTPHIYISMFLFCKESSAIYRFYSSRICKPIRLTGDALKRRKTASLATWRFKSPVLTVAFSSEGDRVAFGCRQGEIGILDAYSGTTLVDFQGHAYDVNSIAFTPDNTCIASGSDDHTIQLWDAAEGTKIGQPLQHDKVVNAVAFSPDGTHIASASNDHIVRVWSIGRSKLAQLVRSLNGHTSEVWTVAYSPSGNFMASGSQDGTIVIWEVDGGAIFRQLKNHGQPMRSIAFSPNSTYIVSGSHDPMIQLWDTQSGTIINDNFQGQKSIITALAFTSDGQRVITGSYDGTIQIWDPLTGHLVAGPFEGHTNHICSIASSVDGTRVVSGSDDSTIRIWNTQDLYHSVTLLRNHDQHNSSQPLSESASSESINLTSSEGHNRSVYSVAFSPDGKRIASGSSDQSICVWSAPDGKLISGPFKGHTDDIWSVTFSPDGRKIISGSSDNTIHIWDLGDSRSEFGPLAGHSSIVCSVAASPNGSIFASGSNDRTIRIWDLKTGKPVLNPIKGHTKAISSVAFAPNGRLLVSGSIDKTIRVWNSEDGSLFAGPFLGHTTGITSVTFSPDGAFIASGSLDCKIQVWRMSTNTPVFALGQLPTHDGYVTCVVFSPDGTRIVSSSADRTLKVWDVQDGALVGGPLCGHTESVESVTFHPDGTHFVSGSQDHTIRLWQYSYGEPSYSTRTSITKAGAFNNLPNGCTFDRWRIKLDGWVTTEDARLLFWVPSETLCSLLTPGCERVINRAGVIEVDLSDALFGGCWRECYKSE